MDDNSHGTHCSGTIAAIGNNSIGVTGVNWKAKIMPLKFLGAGGNGSTSKAISCYFICKYDGSKSYFQLLGRGAVIHNHLKMQLMHPLLLLYVPQVIIIPGKNNDENPFYPASYSSKNILAVASIDRYNNISYFSNYGLTSVDLGSTRFFNSEHCFK